jgi:choline dehydrogenase-like flavoprotein
LTSRDISIGVIGGGIGGLAAALSLLRAGLDVHVYEQAPEAREVGAGILESTLAMNGPLAAELLLWAIQISDAPQRGVNIERMCEPTNQSCELLSIPSLILRSLRRAGAGKRHGNERQDGGRPRPGAGFHFNPPSGVIFRPTRESASRDTGRCPWVGEQRKACRSIHRGRRPAILSDFREGLRS